MGKIIISFRLRVVLAAMAAALLAPAAQAQITLPEREPLDPRIDQRRGEDLQARLPDYYGQGTDASKSWITPKLVTRSEESDPPSGEGAPDLPEITPPSDSDRTPVGPPFDFRFNFPPVPGGGQIEQPRSTDGRLDEIVVINPNRLTAIEWHAECFAYNGRRVFIHRANVDARAIDEWVPVHYRGRGDGAGEIPLDFWCVIYADAPIVAHARTVGGDYVSFFIGAR